MQRTIRLRTSCTQHCHKVAPPITARGKSNKEWRAISQLLSSRLHVLPGSKLSCQMQAIRTVEKLLEPICLANCYQLVRSACSRSAGIGGLRNTPTSAGARMRLNVPFALEDETATQPGKADTAMSARQPGDRDYLQRSK